MPRQGFIRDRCYRGGGMKLALVPCASGRSRRALFAWALLCLTVPVARAAPMPVLVVDPAHTDTGDAIVDALAALPRDFAVQKVDVAQLRKLAAPQSGVIVWLCPEPSLYNDRATQ